MMGTRLINRLQGSFPSKRFDLYRQTLSQRGYVRSFEPTFPPPPSEDELYANGLPLFQRIWRHRTLNRTMLSGWPNPAGRIESVTYKTALNKSSQVSHLLVTNMKVRADYDNLPKLIAHLNVPGWEYIACQFGAFGIGFGSVPLSLSHSTRELEHILSDSKPSRILIGGGSMLDDNDSTVNNQPTLVPENVAQLVEAAKNVGMSDRILHLRDVWGDGEYTPSKYGHYTGDFGVVSTMDDPALVLYTSGTTGKPKGVVITHRNLYHQINDLIEEWEWDPSDVALHVLPLHNIHGIVNLHCAAYIGAHINFQYFHAETLWKTWAEALPLKVRNPFDKRKVLENFGRTVNKRPQPTVFIAAPTIYAKLLEATDNLPKRLVRRAVRNSIEPMRLMVSGSSELPAPILNQWRDLTSHVPLKYYGTTEFAVALSDPFDTHKRKKGTRRLWHVGQPLKSVKVRIVDETTGKFLDKKSGKSGELQVKGPTVFQKYLNQPEATKEAFTDGWFRTGDIAQYNAKVKQWRLLGQPSVDIIESGGQKISALEIERELLEHPDVAEVVILGVPDETLGERVAMVCRFKDVIIGEEEEKEEQEKKLENLDQFREWCKERMEEHKVPSLVRIVDEIPKNAMGEVIKRNLQTLFQNS